jgi:hypothetical protein
MPRRSKEGEEEATYVAILSGRDSSSGGTRRIFKKRSLSDVASKLPLNTNGIPDAGEPTAEEAKRVSATRRLPHKNDEEGKLEVS